MFRSALLKSFLVLALLFVQQGAVTHGIAHTLAEQSQEKSLPHHQYCDLCAVYAQVGGAVGSSSVHFDFVARTGETLDTHTVTFRSTSFAAFAARAPPRSV